MSSLRRCSTVLLLALSPWLTSAALAQEYHVTDLGALDRVNSWAWAVSDRGEVAGWSTDGSQYPQAYRWAPRGGMRGLGRLAGASASYALGVNDARTVAGYAGLSFERTRAFRWDRRRGLVELATLGGEQSWARAINSRGQIVGEADTADGERHLALWQGDTVSDLGSLPGEPFATGEAINALGQVAGNAGQAFFWRDGAFTVLPTLGGKSLARSLNDLGHVVGSSAFGDGGCGTCSTRAALWRDGKVSNLGVLAPPGAPAMTSVAHGVNNAGEVVGWSTTLPLGSHHGFYCRDGCPDGPVDLNDLVPAGWTISEAFAINNAGEIAAIGHFGPSGLLRALLLTPQVPRLVALAPRPGRAGRINTFELRWATPAAQVLLLAGTGPGSTPVEACAATVNLAAARPVGTGVADRDGGLSLRAYIPPAQAGEPLYLQALDLASCTLSAIAVHVLD